jgi:hypothetical protein
MYKFVHNFLFLYIGTRKLPKTKKQSKFTSYGEAQPSIEDASKKQEEYKKMLEEKYLLEKGSFAEQLIAAMPEEKKRKKAPTKSVQVDEAIDRLEVLITHLQAGKDVEATKQEMKALIETLVQMNALSEHEVHILQNKFAL